MEKWISFLQMNKGILTEAAVIVLGLLLVIFLARILRQIKKLNRSLSSITKNVQEYFDVIMQEEPQVQEEPQAQEALQSRRMDEGQSSLEREQRKQEEEKVFNAVLQEYFS